MDVNNLDDFIWIESKGEYHHEDDCVCCDECGTNILLDDAMCSEVTEEYYCCKECMEKAENESSGRTGITPNMMMNGMRITPTLPGSISGMNRKVSMRIKASVRIHYAGY